jgi:ribosomal protein L7/L12
MIELIPSDLRPLDTFEYLPRWNWPSSDALPKNTLAQFQALTHTKAIEVWQQTSAYRQELLQYIFDSIPEFLPSTSRFSSIVHVDVEQEGMDNTTKVLHTLDVPDDNLFIVMWELKLALAMTWKAFSENWVDLCLPSSDDVTVCSVAETFVLQYYHEDQIVYGHVRFLVSKEIAEEQHVSPQVQAEARDEILRLLQVQDKIAAIKLYQQETGVPFREAKEAVDKLITEVM